MTTLRLMPWILRHALPRKTTGITLPPWGIYLRPGHEDNPVLQAHEAVHWAQYERMGLLPFYAVYLWGLVRYGYKAHPMEIEARAATSDRLTRNRAGK